MLVGRDTSDSDFNTILKTGGEKKHTLSIEEMPSHTHAIAKGNGDDSSPLSFAKNDAYTQSTVSTAGQYWWSPTKSYGGSQSHNNLQPYIVVYRWRRIA